MSISLLVILVACQDSKVEVGDDTGDPTDHTGDADTETDADTGTDTDADTDVDTDTDTEPSDADGDGFSVADGDCDDANGNVNPAAAESSDALDNDCDGYVDEWEVCSAGGDFGTIQDALDAATDGQLILVCAGTYHENIDYGGVDAVLESRDGPEVTSIDGGGIASAATFKRGETNAAVLEGFTVTNGFGADGGFSSDPEDFPGGGLWIVDSSPTVVGNVITGNEATHGGGVYVYGSAAEPIIRQNVVSDNVSGIGGGVLYHDGPGGYFENNVVDSNVAENGGGASLLDVGDLRMANNTFVGNEATYVGDSSSSANLYLYEHGGAIIDSNIFAYGAGGAGIAGSSGASVTSCDYNDIYDNDAGSVNNVDACHEASNIHSDPMFTSRSSGDFTLQGSSPCIDAGNPDSAYNDSDGSRNDMGAYGGPEGSGW